MEFVIRYLYIDNFMQGFHFFCFKFKKNIIQSRKKTHAWNSIKFAQFSINILFLRKKFHFTEKFEKNRAQCLLRRIECYRQESETSRRSSRLQLFCKCILICVPIFLQQQQQQTLGSIRNCRYFMLDFCVPKQLVQKSMAYQNDRIHRPTCSPEIVGNSDRKRWH